MPLVNMSELLYSAREGKYAVGSFSVANMEMVMGILRAAEETESPVILQIAEVRLKNSPLHLIGPLMVAAAENSEVPVAVHFDHGKTEEKISEALDIGFTSVMFDGSHLPFDENVKVSKRIKRLAEEYDADLECEIGCVGGSEDGSENIAMNCSSPDEAAEICEKVSPEALAIAIGNAHGNYKDEPKLRFDILEKTANTVDVPLVLHGGTGISEADFKKCISLGINKINIATATFDSVAAAAREAFESGAVKGYYDLQSAEEQGAYLNAIKHINIFGCAGKAFAD